MYMKNFETAPTAEHLNYKGLKKDGRYLFSREGKYFAWFLVLVCIMSSSVFLLLYGINFGTIKTYLWITSFVVMFFMSLFITTPIRILIISFIKGKCFKLRVLLIKRPVSPSVLTNSPDPAKKKEVLNFRKYNAHLYKPMPLYKLQNRIHEIKYNLELRNLSLDIISYIFFMITVFYVVLINKTPLGYMSTGVLKNLVVDGSYTNTIPFRNVTTYKTLLEYLNYTFLPALLLNHYDYDKVFTGGEGPTIDYRSRRFLDMDDDYDSEDETLSRGERATGGKNISNFYQRGWTMDQAVKLIGRPRLRQIRVKGGTCVQLADLESRNLECAGEFTTETMEDRNFTLRWDPWPTKELVQMDEDPWVYRSGWETQTMPLAAEYSSYPWGGYILNFGRNLNDSRIVLQYLDHFEWIDMKTRVIFIEFTTYNVNSNIFNVVTLIAEKSAVGYMIPSYKIITCRLLFLATELETLSFVMLLLFSLLLFFFFLREGIRMHRTTMRPYFRRTFAVLDLLIVFFGLTTLVLFILKSYYIQAVLEDLEKADNNKFVSFLLASHWSLLSIYVDTVLLQMTLFCCCNQFLNLFIQIFVFTFGFAMFFHLFLNVYAYSFRSFSLSFSTMIGHSSMVEDDFVTLMTFKDVGIFSSSRWYFAPLFFACFAVVINILFVNLFIAVICLYFSTIRNVALVNKYSLTRYLKYIVTADRVTDLLKIKGEVPYEKEEEMLRLKGGGPASSKKSGRKLKKLPKLKRKVYEHEEESRSTFLTDFIRERKYELLKYHALLNERATFMKYLAISLLSEDEEQIRYARDKALRCYYIVITKDTKHVEKIYKRDSYVLVVKDVEKVPINTKRLLEMKKVVEDYAQSKDWLTEENPDQELDSAEHLKGSLNLLYQRLDSLGGRV